MPAYFIVTEEPIEGFDLFGNGEALALASDVLDRLAADAGVRPLMDFFSMEPAEVETLFGMLGLDATGTEPLPDEDAADLAADPDPEPELDSPPAEVWFQASAGLATVQGLIAAVEADPEPFDRNEDLPTARAVLADLREFATILTNLAAEGTRWHLMVDI